MARAPRGFVSIFAAILLAPTWRAQTGLPPEWEIRKQIEALAESLTRLKPVLAQVRAEEWPGRGAPDTYIEQLKTLRTELGYLERSAEILRARPDRLTAVLDTFLRLDRFQLLLASLEEGVRRYQNPALADLLRSVYAEGAPSRESLRQYLLDLAQAKEQELEIADREAQRCRDVLIRQPPARPSRSGGPGTQERP